MKTTMSVLRRCASRSGGRRRTALGDCRAGVTSGPAGVRGVPANLRRALGDERGVALIIVLLSTMLLTALAVSLVMITSSETLLTANYRNAH